MYMYISAESPADLKAKYDEMNNSGVRFIKDSPVLVKSDGIDLLDYKSTSHPDKDTVGTYVAKRLAEEQSFCPEEPLAIYLAKLSQGGQRMIFQCVAKNNSYQHPYEIFAVSVDSNLLHNITHCPINSNNKSHRHS